MSKIKNERAKNTSENFYAKLVGGVALGAVIVTVGVNAVNRNAQPAVPATNDAHREYTIGPHDTEFSILQRAYPGRDWRTITKVVESQLPVEDRADHVLRAGETLSFGMDAQIGKPVEVSSEAASVSAG